LALEAVQCLSYARLGDLAGLSEQHGLRRALGTALRN
jgi:hypothetical protein